MKGNAMNHGHDMHNGPLCLKDVPRPVTFWDLVEGRLPE